MNFSSISIFASLFLLTTITACGFGDDASCTIGVSNWSTADSGGLCQVNFFGDTEYAVYCAMGTAGDYECACGPAVDSPLEFISPNFCELSAKERACTAISMCSFPI